MKYIKEFADNAAYTAYTSSADFVTPNVSYIIEDNAVEMTPYVPPMPKWVATYTTGTTSVECDGSSAITQDEITLTDLVDVQIGSCVTSIDGYVFYNCNSLTSITIPDSVTTIGNGAFNECSSLTSIVIPSGVTTINTNTFQNCSGLTSIDIPDSVTSIGISAFRYCSGITSCTIGSGVTTIGATAFNDCTSLTSVTIGSGITNIGKSAFYNCKSLTSITVNATNPPILGYGAFDNTKNCPIYVPSESVNTYKSKWSTYSSRITAIA